MKRFHLALVAVAATGAACLYDFEKDYQDCKAFGRCAAVDDTDAGVVDAGGGGAGGGGGGGGETDAGVDAGFSWKHVRDFPGHVRGWGVWAIDAGHLMYVAAYPGNSGQAYVAELINGQWVENPFLGFVSPFPAVASTNGLTCVLGEYATARTYTFPNASWDGGALPGTYNHNDDYYSLWTAGQYFVIGGDFGNIAISQGDEWRDAGTLSPAVEIYDGWASSLNNQYVTTTDRKVWHFDGGGWTALTTRPRAAGAIWGVSPDEVWGAGQEVFRLRNGVFDTLDAGLESWQGIWASGPNDVFISGSNGWLAHWNGTSFVRTRLSPYNLTTVHGTGPGDVWVADIDGGLWHYGP